MCQEDTITFFLEDSLVSLDFSCLLLCVLLFMQKFRDFRYMQSAEIAKQIKLQRPSSNVDNTHTTGAESENKSQVKNFLWRTQ